VKETLVVGLLALAAGGAIHGTVVANPLAVSFSLSTASVAAGTPFGATATVSNLGAAPLASVDVTLQADSSIAGAVTRHIASIAGGATATVAWQLCALAPGSYVVLAKGQTGGFPAESAAQVLQVGTGTTPCPESATGSGSVSTDGEGDGATAADPIETTVVSPVPGTVSIDERQASAVSPSGLTVLGWQVQISAPAASSAAPLRLTFELDASLVAGLDPLTIQVSRNGLVVDPCAGDPCVARRALQPDGDLELVVLTSAASLWTFGTTYPFTGFFAPVDNPPTLNLLQAGKAVPVKFALGGDRGLGLFASGYPASQRISCDSSAPVDLVELTSTASASGLGYDAATDRYTYVWKTDKAWAGSCRELVLRLVDGTEHRARFQLR
jgi:hypothetical protein